jgi:hypothetical protein
MNQLILRSFTNEMVKTAVANKKSDKPSLKGMVSRAAKVGAFTLAIPAGAYVGYRATRPLIARAPEFMAKHPNMATAARIGGPLMSTALMTAGVAAMLRGLHSAALE